MTRAYEILAEQPAAGESSFGVVYARPSGGSAEWTFPSERGWCTGWTYAGLPVPNVLPQRPERRRVVLPCFDASGGCTGGWLRR